MIRTSYLAASVGLLLLSACAAARGPERITTLRLQSHGFDGAGAAPSSRSIQLSPVQARGLTAGRRYVYVEAAAPAELRQASTLFWEEPPTTALEHVLVEALRSRFTSVTGSGMAVQADERVDVRLDRFEEETDTARSARAVVAFEATAADTAGRGVVFIGRYCAASPIKGGAPSARADAFSDAMSRAALALAHDVAAGVASPSAC
jgi:ABC-type uncharacterized transport system auxiliary subunit